MSEEWTLEEFGDRDADGDDQQSEWRSVKLSDVARKRSVNVDPDEVDLDRHVGLEHIEPNTSKPDWEPLDGLSSTKRRFEPGDVLFAKLRPNLEKAAQPDFEGVASTDIFPIIADEGVNQKYLLYCLSSKPAFDHARRTSVGTRMPRTSWNLFRNFEFELPPLEEQRKIASVLYNVDQYIQKADIIIDQTERTKEGVAQQLFHNGFGGEETVETWVGELPTSWDFVPFSEIIESTRNGIYKAEDAYGEGYRIAKMGNALENLKLDMSSFDRLELTDDEKEKFRLKQGDLIFARRAQEVSGAGDCALVPELEELTVFESSLIRVRLNEEALPMFYMQYFNGPVGTRSIERIVTETSISGVASSDLVNLKVPVPNLKEQERIAATLSNFDDQKEAIEIEMAQLQRLKQGLMQDLLSGEVRTTDADIEVLEEVAQHG